jgi:hypothetical protein
MPRDKVGVARRAIDGYNHRDIDAMFAEFATPDFKLHSGIASSLGGEDYSGREGVERFGRDASETLGAFQTVAEEFRDLGDRVLVLGTLTRRGRCSGAPVEASHACILDFATTGSGASGRTSIATKDCARRGSPSRRRTGGL